MAVGRHRLPPTLALAIRQHAGGAGGLIEIHRVGGIHAGLQAELFNAFKVHGAPQAAWRTVYDDHVCATVAG